MPIISTDLNSAAGDPYRGHIDLIDTAHGIQGWAVNLTPPCKPPVLVLRIGTRMLARSTPNRPRDDISALLNRKINAGFAFDSETLRHALRAAASPDDEIAILVSGTEFALPSGGPPMRVRDLALPIVPTVQVTDPWQIGVTHGAEVSIDRMLLVPGLGCMVEGWVLSPQRRVESIRLRIGGAVLTARPDATYRRARADLLAEYPDAGRLVDEAGLVALFTGDEAPADGASAVLQLEFAGGATANFALSAGLPRLLGYSATAADALAFFPSLTAESFFPRFAAAAATGQRAALVAPAALSVAPSPRTFVLVLPETRSDFFLVFETIAAACRENLVDALTLVAAADSNRADAPWHLRDLLASHPVPASLFTIADAGEAFHLLGLLLRAVGAERFVFAAAGTFLPLPAWRMAAAYLRGAGDGVLFLGAQDDAFAPPGACAFATSRCFAWNAPSFLQWSASAPVFLSGHYRDNLLVRAAPHTLQPGMVLQGRLAAPSPIEQAINSLLYEAAAA